MRFFNTMGLSQFCNVIRPWTHHGCKFPQPRSRVGQRLWRRNAAGLLGVGSIILRTFCPTARAGEIAFFYALDADYRAFKAEAQVVGEQPVKVAGRRIDRLEVGGHRVYAVKMGSGAVETAISASALLARFPCERAFSIGPVGALDDAMPVGAWREVAGIVNYQRGSWGRSGFMVGKDVSVESGPTRSDDLRAQLKLTTPIAGATSIIVASGEMFIASSEYRDQLRFLTGAQAVDMNLFGLTTACGEAGVPLFSWRVASDRADDGANEAFRAFVKTYDGAGGRAVVEIIRHFPADQGSPASYPKLKELLERASQ